MKVFSSNIIKPLFSKWDFFLVAWLSVLTLSLGYKINIIPLLALFVGAKLLAKTSQLLYKLLVVIYSLIGFLYAPTGIIYGSPDVNVVGSFLYTTSEESIGYLKQTPYYAFLLGLIVLMLGIALTIEKKSTHAVASKKSFIMLSLFFIVLVSFGPIKKNRIDLSAYRFINDLVTAYRTVSTQNQGYAAIMQKKPIWQPVIKSRRYHTYLLVIGESVRRDYVHAFGGQFNNTPWLDSVPATLFYNYISAGPATVISLTNTLVYKQDREKQLNNSVVTLAEKSGFETWWLSNQGVKSHSDSPIARIAKSANHTGFINTGKADYSAASSDENLLPLLAEALKNPAGDKLIILHLMGSHPRACDRTQGRFDSDIGSKELSCYVTSIAMTDSLLHKANQLLSNATANWTMMYFSDHGLSYIDKNSSRAYLTHGDNTKQNYQVPFFILSSDSTQRHVISQRRSGLDFLSTFAQWLNIDDPAITSRCSMLSKSDCDEVNTVYDFNEQLTNYAALPSIP